MRNAAYNNIGAPHLTKIKYNYSSARCQRIYVTGCTLHLVTAAHLRRFNLFYHEIYDIIIMK